MLFPVLASLLHLLLAAVALLSAALLIARSAASKLFDIDDFNDATMSIGHPCAVCGKSASKKCSRCQATRYCSQACQSNHWNSHKLNCQQVKALNDTTNAVSSNNGARQRRKSSGFSSISLVPARGTCKVLQEPKRILFPYEDFVKLFNWDKPGFYPCGLLNCGNSCFANVVLQCLTSTRPLLAYLLESDHSRGCIRKRDDWCFLCELQIHVQRARESLYPFSPINILSHLPNIGGNFGHGKQEDAHELMRFAIDTMQSICLDEFGGEKALEPSSQETTLIQYIFGGYLQSQVLCTKCNQVSNRYENMMDLTVEIQGDAESLEECLDLFTVKEWLDGENMYKCDGCNDYVKARKQLTIHQAPNILTIALKRYQGGRFGKLNKRITFPERLDLTPYMSGNKDDNNLYTLYAVVVHVDMLNASYFGHYICYTKDYYGRWYRIDDSKVMAVEVEEVLAQGAYMLFYTRRDARREAFVKPVKPAKKIPILDATPDIFEPTSNIIPFFRDTGHERSLSNGSSSLDGKEIDYMDLGSSAVSRPVSVTNGSVDFDMEDCLGTSAGSRPDSVTNGSMDFDMEEYQLSLFRPKDLIRKPNASSCVQVDTSPAKFIQSNLSTSETSSTEDQAMECKETSTTSGPHLSPSMPKPDLEPCDSSVLDNHMKQDSGLNIITEKATQSLVSCKESSLHEHSNPPLSAGVDGVNDASKVAACSTPGSSNGVDILNNSSCRYEGTKSLASSRKNNFGEQPMPLFASGFLTRPIKKDPSDQLSRIKQAPNINGYSNGHMQLDIEKEHFASSELQRKSGHELMNVGRLANTNCDVSTSPELFSNSDGKAIISGLAPGFLSKSYTTSVENRVANKELEKVDTCSKVKCNDYAGLQSSDQRCLDRDTSSEVRSGTDNYSGNDKGVNQKSATSYLSPGFLNKLDKNPVKIGKTDPPSVTKANGFIEQLLTNGDNVHKPEAPRVEPAAPFLNRGFLDQNKPYKRPIKVGHAKENGNLPLQK